VLIEMVCWDIWNDYWIACPLFIKVVTSRSLDDTITKVCGFDDAQPGDWHSSLVWTMFVLCDTNIILSMLLCKF